MDGESFFKQAIDNGEGLIQVQLSSGIQWVGLIAFLNVLHYMIVNFLGGSKRKFFS